MHLGLLDCFFSFLSLWVISRTCESSFCQVSIGSEWLQSLTRSQEQFFLTCSIEKMGGQVLPFLHTLEQTLETYAHNRSSESVTHIICPYLRPGQRRRLQQCIGDSPISVLSSNWLYSCIDQYTCLPTTDLNPWDDLLFTPSVE